MESSLSVCKDPQAEQNRDTERPSHQPEDETGTGQGSNSSKVSGLLRGNAGILV